MRQSRLAPDGRPAPFRVDRLYVLTTRQCGERVPDRIEVLDHGALLDDDVRIAAFVVIAGAMQIDRASIDPGVDAQQGHTHATDIAVRECPEAAVRVAVLG